MTASEIEEKVYERAVDFGLFTQSMRDSRKRGQPNGLKRSNIKSEAFAEGKAYFGFVRPEESPNGVYYDLSFVVFPQETTGDCIVSIVVGSAGYQRDYDMAAMAGTRRMFLRLADSDGLSFVKNDFTDIETPATDLENAFDEYEGLEDLESVIGVYSKCILAARVVDPDEDFDVIEAWLAQYAKLRHWSKNKAQSKAVDTAILKCVNSKPVDYIDEVKRLLDRRKYVVLQGAPGCGKTWTANNISNRCDFCSKDDWTCDNDKNVFFTQFHAETTYADFVYGIKPVLNGTNVAYEAEKGILLKAIDRALEVADKKEKVLLIIDEINRANLANVLGPVFYLFEHQTGARKVKLKIADTELEKLPDNLYVLATMNTADRSLAVVDFALRRRFAWYTLRPQEIVPDKNHVFHNELFLRFSEIFQMYATDEELNLQPGQSYFLTPKKDADDIMKDRLIYELMPLIKEYLSEGLMRKASDRFAALFFEETGLYLYE